MGRQDQKTTGKRLKEARRRARISRPKLAEKACCSPSTIKALELGKRIPFDTSVDRIARALNIDMAWLRYGDPTHIAANEMFNLLLNIESLGYLDIKKGSSLYHTSICLTWAEIKNRIEEASK